MARALHPRISVNQISSWKWTTAQDIAFYREQGITTIAAAQYKLEEDPAAGIAAIRDADLRCVTVATGTGGRSLVAPADPDAWEVLRGGIDSAAALGAPCCYFTSGGTPDRMPTDDAYAALVKAIAPARDYAARKGVRLAIENNSIPTRASGFIHTLADAAALAGDADIDIVLDIQNCWVERRLPELFRHHVPHIALVQLSDFKVGEPAMLNRRVPGDGSIAIEWILGHLLDAGYAGAFDIEMLGPHIEEEGYASAIGRATDWLSDCLDRLGA